MNQNKRPEWLRCEKCLWFLPLQSYKPSFCHHSSRVLTPDDVFESPNFFCEQWTCANCWQTWDEFIIVDPGDGEVEYKGYINHDTCLKVRLEDE